MKKIIFTVFCVTAAFASSMATAEKSIVEDSHKEEIRRLTVEIRQNARKIAEGKLSPALEKIYRDDLEDKYSDLYALECDGQKPQDLICRMNAEQAIKEAREMLEKDIWYPFRSI